MRRISMLISLLAFLLIGTCVALAGPFEKGPVKEPKVKSPLVIKNSKGKVIFEEYFKERKPQYEPYYLGDEVAGFKVYDPATGAVMLDVALKEGVLSREIEVRPKIGPHWKKFLLRPLSLTSTFPKIAHYFCASPIMEIGYLVMPFPRMWG